MEHRYSRTKIISSVESEKGEFEMIIEKEIETLNKKEYGIEVSGSYTLASMYRRAAAGCEITIRAGKIYEK